MGSASAVNAHSIRASSWPAASAPSYQRIMTALGSGSEAAPHAYYAGRDLLTGG